MLGQGRNLLYFGRFWSQRAFNTGVVCRSVGSAGAAGWPGKNTAAPKAKNYCRIFQPAVYVRRFFLFIPFTHVEVYILHPKMSFLSMRKGLYCCHGGGYMTTGEKIALLRKRRGITQEELSEILQVSRQSISKWEMNICFPETDKLIRLSKLFDCSIDYLLTNTLQKSEESDKNISADTCCRFIRECGYFFLATSVQNQPRLRPFGMIYSNGSDLFIVTDKRKSVFFDLTGNPQIEIASYNISARKWIRISGKAETEDSIQIRERLIMVYPVLKQKYPPNEEEFLAVFKLFVADMSIN